MCETMQRRWLQVHPTETENSSTDGVSRLTPSSSVEETRETRGTNQRNVEGPVLCLKDELRRIQSAGCASERESWFEMLSEGIVNIKL